MSTFVPLVKQLAKAERMPWLRTAQYPATISVDSDETVRKNIVAITIRQIIGGLMDPVTSEAGPSALVREEVVVSGPLERVSEYFRQKEWTDGLPIVPPTADKIREFLRYTDREPHETVAILRPGNLAATPWNLAANGVMAGCDPRMMPILIATAEAIGDPHYNLEQIGTTAGFVPFIFINGPIIRQLDIQFGVGLISTGPNTALGRALGLIIRNIAGYKPGQQYMGTYGYVLPFVLAEDEDGCPWNPYHVEQGFSPDTSTVTAGGTFNWGFQAFPSGTDPEGLLKIICRQIVKHVNLDTSAHQGHMQGMTVALTRGVAQAIAAGGYTRKQVEEYLYLNSRVTMEEVNFELKYGNSSGPGTTVRKLLEDGYNPPKEWVDMAPESTVPVMGFPGTTHIVVCGDPNRNKAMPLYNCYSRLTTKKIELPAAWGNLIGQ